MSCGVCCSRGWRERLLNSQSFSACAATHVLLVHTQCTACSSLGLRITDVMSTPKSITSHAGWLQQCTAAAAAAAGVYVNNDGGLLSMACVCVCVSQAGWAERLLNSQSGGACIATHVLLVHAQCARLLFPGGLAVLLLDTNNVSPIACWIDLLSSTWF
jgi:hypothetical protein